MTFDELCKVVKKANKDATVETSGSMVTIKIGTKAIAHVYEKSDYTRPVEIGSSSFREAGYMKIIEAVLEYNDTEFTKRGLTPRWVISIAETHKVMRDYQPSELKQVWLHLRKKEGERTNSLSDWVWKESYDRGNFLTKEQIKDYLTEAYGEGKADKYIDTFIEMFGTRVQ